MNIRHLLSVALVVLASSAYASSGFHYKSSTGDFVGNGGEATYTAANANFAATLQSNGMVTVTVSDPSTGSTIAGLNFAPPAGAALAPGVYADVQYISGRLPSRAGLSAALNNFECSRRAYGGFVIRELNVDSTGAVTAFAADFIQRCDSATAAPLIGQVRYNSAVPLQPDAPTAIITADNPGFDDQIVTLDASNSLPGNSTNLTYSWQQTGGPTVSISDPMASSISFKPTDLPLGGTQFTFKLIVTNSLGLSDSHESSYFVHSKSDRLTYVTMDSGQGDAMGLGKTYLFVPADRLFQVYGKPGYVDLEASDQHDTWDFEFQGPSGAYLTKKTYGGAVMVQFPASGSPSMNVNGDFRACSTISGSFTVQEMKLDSSGLASNFAIKFTQYCDSSPAPLSGTIHYDVVDPSLPTASAGADRTVYDGEAVQLDGSGSSDHDGSIRRYQWSQVSGSTATIEDPTAEKPTVDMPISSGSSDPTAVFKLVVTDNGGFKAADTVTYTMQADNTPPTVSDSSATAYVSSSTTIDLAATGSDGESGIDPASISVVTAPASGTYSTNAKGQLIYTAGSQTGDVSVQYTLADRAGNVSQPGTLTIHVEAAPKPAPTPKSSSGGSGGGGVVSWLGLLGLLSLMTVRRRHIVQVP